MLTATAIDMALSEAVQLRSTAKSAQDFITDSVIIFISRPQVTDTKLLKTQYMKKCYFIDIDMFKRTTILCHNIALDHMFKRTTILCHNIALDHKKMISHKYR